MSELQLVKPTINLKDDYLSMLNEWKCHDEKLVPQVLTIDPSDFQSMLDTLERKSKTEYLEEGKVEASTYWLVENDSKIMGVVNIRHRLNEGLLQMGGHIGYGIRPSERRKGYATIMLKLALDLSKQMNLSKVLVTCDKTNIGSAKTILKNGGSLENEIEVNGVVIQRYWIQL